MQRFDFRLAAVVALAALAAACGGSGSAPVTRKKPLTPFLITTLYNQSAQDWYNMPSAVVNVPYAFGLLTNVGAKNTDTQAPVTFELYGKTPMPPGLSLSPNGIIGGTPSQPGFYSFNVIAVDSSAPNPKISAPAGLSIEIGQAGAVLTQVGQNSLGGQGQNGEVAVQGHLAFVGTLGAGSPLSLTPSAGGASCPSTGIKIVDLSQPASPQLLTIIPGTPGLAQPVAKAAMVSSASFYPNGTGDLLAIAQEPCAAAAGADSGVVGGIELFDVTNPSTPVYLGTWKADYAGHDSATWNQHAITAGVRSLSIVSASGHIYVLASVPGSEELTYNSSDPQATQGDLRVIDVTNPAQPVEIGSWSLSAVTGVNPLTLAVGADQRVFLDEIHTAGVTVNQTPVTYAYLAYWDQGIAIVNVTDPATLVETGNDGQPLSNPQALVTHVVYPTFSAAQGATGGSAATTSLPEGNSHNALPIENGQALLITDQICAADSSITNPSTATVCGFTVPLTNVQGWGFLRLYDLTTPSEPIMEGFLDTAQNQSDPAPDDGIYTAENLAWNGDAAHPHAYVSWGSNGVLDVDVSSLSTPNLLAAFVPPAMADPQGSDPAKNNPDAPLIYGIGAYAQNGNYYIVASDINSGLYVIQESAPPSFAIITSSLPAGNAGVLYNGQLETVNGVGQITYQVVSGSFPPGLAAPDANGVIKGVPTTAGSYTFTVMATDTQSHSTSATFTVVVTSNLAIATTSQTLPNKGVATLNESYSANFTAVNGTAPYTWAVTAGNVPPGMTLGSDGALSGTSTVAGTSNFSVTVTDSSIPANSVTQSFNLTVDPLEFSTASVLPDGGQDTSYTASLNLLNGTLPFTFVLANNTSLPPGLSLTASTGGITGTPTQAGTFPFTITVSDSDGQTATQQFSIKIEPFAIATTSLPAGTVGVGYYQTIQLATLDSSTITIGGTSGFTFTLLSGSLPDGLTLQTSSSASYAIIAGVPTSAGSYTFTIQATDANNTSAQQTYTLVIQPGS